MSALGLMPQTPSPKVASREPLGAVEDRVSSAPASAAGNRIQHPVEVAGPPRAGCLQCGFQAARPAPLPRRP